jgi:hypothetical protein
LLYIGRFSLIRKGIYLFVSPKFLFEGGDVLNFDELKCELVAKVKTINWKQPVLILFLGLAALFVVMELLAPLAEARWGVRWGGSAGWGRWGGWGTRGWGGWGTSGWGGWGRPWYGGWGGWW